jgi:hypothetical protein
VSDAYATMIVVLGLFFGQEYMNNLVKKIEELNPPYPKNAYIFLSKINEKEKSGEKLTSQSMMDKDEYTKQIKDYENRKQNNASFFDDSIKKLAPFNVDLKTKQILIKTFQGLNKILDLPNKVVKDEHGNKELIEEHRKLSDILTSIISEEPIKTPQEQNKTPREIISNFFKPQKEENKENNETPFPGVELKEHAFPGVLLRTGLPEQTHNSPPITPPITPPKKWVSASPIKPPINPGMRKPLPLLGTREPIIGGGSEECLECKYSCPYYLTRNKRIKRSRRSRMY